MNEAGYYIIPDLEALNKETDYERLRLIRRRIAANIGDRDALFAILGEASGDFYDFYGDSELPTLSTEDTIDSFLEHFGGDRQPKPTSKAITEIPVAPAIDYALQLEKQLPRPTRRWKRQMQLSAPSTLSSGRIHHPE